MHTLIVGGTGYGKSTFAKQLAQHASDLGRDVIVLDPMLDTDWPIDAVITDDTALFEEKARESLNAWIFIDEGHDSIGATRWNDNLHWLFRYGRHYGHRVTVITQHPTDLPPIVRNQCRRLITFNIDGDSAYRMSRQYRCELLEEAPTLDQFEYIYVERGSSEPVRQYLETEF